MRKKNSILLLIALVFALTVSACSHTSTKTSGEETSQLMVGAAVRDITPAEHIFPLFRGKREYGGILDTLHVRAIALSSGDTKTLILCSETIKCPPAVVEAVAKHTGLPLEAIFSTVTHCHTAPSFPSPVDLNFKEDSEMTNEQVWLKYFLEQTLAAADEALAEMEPASVGIAYSESYININRHSLYNKIDENGTVTEYYGYGFNPEGISDKTLATIRFNNVNGDPIAFIVNYGSHALVMHNNTCFDGKLGMSADIPGMVSGYLETKYAGSVAMWLMGPAGEQQTIIQNMMFTRNPMTGEQEIKNSNSYDMLMYLSKLHFADIETALSGIKDYNTNAKVNHDFMQSVIPAKDSGDFSVSLQLLRIGDIALIGFPGELFTPIGMHMKENSLLKNTLIVSLTWQRDFQSTRYHADDESIARGGPGTDAEFKPGYITDALTSMMNSLIEKTNH